MLFLPPIEDSSYDFLAPDVFHIRFLIDDKLYCLYGDLRAIGMKTLDMNSLKVEGLNLVLDDVDNEIAFWYPTVVVHNNRAYLWNDRQQFFCEGRIEGNNFHWRKAETRGSKTFFGIPFGCIHKSDPYYCVTEYDYQSGEHCLYYINLNGEKGNLTWQKSEVTFRDQSTLDLIDDNISFLDSLCDRIIVIDNHLHVFHHYYKSSSKFNVTRYHLVLDIAKLEWSLDEAYYELPQFAKIGNREWSINRAYKELPPSATSKIFSDGSHLWIVCAAKENFKSVLYRYDHDSGLWMKMAEVADDDYRFRVREFPVTMGSRVIFTRSSMIRNDLSVRPLLYVLELEPTLFARAAVAIARDIRASRLALVALPAEIKDNLIESGILNDEEGDRWRVEEPDSDKDDVYRGNSQDDVDVDENSENGENLRNMDEALRAAWRWIETAEDLDDVDESSDGGESAEEEEDDDAEDNAEEAEGEEAHNEDDDPYAEAEEGDDNVNYDNNDSEVHSEDQEDEDPDGDKDDEKDYGSFFRKVERLSKLASRVVNRLSANGMIIW